MQVGTARTKDFGHAIERAIFQPINIERMQLIAVEINQMPVARHAAVGAKLVSRQLHQLAAGNIQHVPLPTAAAVGDEKRAVGVVANERPRREIRMDIIRAVAGELANAPRSWGLCTL